MKERVQRLDQRSKLRKSAAILPTGAATRAKQLFMGTVYGTSGFWWKFIQSAATFHYALS
jgi:hypothetical protein